MGRSPSTPVVTHYGKERREERVGGSSSVEQGARVGVDAAERDAARLHEARCDRHQGLLGVVATSLQAHEKIEKRRLRYLPLYSCAHAGRICNGRARGELVFFAVFRPWSVFTFDTS